MSGKIKWSQTIAGIILLLGLIILGIYLGGQKANLPIQLFAGVVLGYTLTRSRFGFAGGIKRIYMRGEGSLTKALIVLVGITAIVFMGIQWQAASNGAVPQYLATDGQAFIPGTQNVYFTNIATIVGGVIFGIGMMLAGGCGSGTLADFGEGQGRSLIAFIFFVLSAAPGHWARKVIDRTVIGKLGVQLHLPQVFGYFGALLVTFIGLGVIWWYTVQIENKRKAQGFYKDPQGDWEEFEHPLMLDGSEKFFSYETYHKFFIERWNFMLGALVLALGAIFVMVTMGKAWGVSTPLVTLDVAVLQKLGFSFSEENFGSHLEKVEKGLLMDGGTVRNIGLFFGCTISFLLANRFKIDFDFSLKDALLYALGGLMLGFGSRFALGCNIGAMYSAISNFSLSGWVFLVAMSVGGLMGLKYFQGKINIIPIPDHLSKGE